MINVGTSMPHTRGAAAHEWTTRARARALMPTLPGLLPLLSHATAAAGGALGADRNPALWPVTVPPRISRTRVQPLETGREGRGTLTAPPSCPDQEAAGMWMSFPRPS